MSSLVENTGSTARDFCMLERNILSHFKLGLLLSLLSSSVLLHARLPSPGADGTPEAPSHSKAGLPIAALQMFAAIAAICAGAWEYWSGNKDLRSMRAFLVASKPHSAMLTVVAGVVITTCVILLSSEDAL